MAEVEVTICNQKGLHARAAAKFVKLAVQFDAQVLVGRGDQQVSGRSIMGLMMLAAGPGCAICIAAEGPDHEAALSALSELLLQGFGEED
jgi:phosphocarrier protein HPr